ncbi:zinc transporter ZupT [Andreesenia angusta]|uniref:Zinc transporter ZupT n=1 Tax=Andreesenia angusta TaxID=39480 RepID=A0A1S1V6D1_9FIRM|nr:zinc transporter ZupT [Andreesenia angusta]OHW62102.1 zinc transporter ZupT [Andreesenia angusta]
MEDNLILAFAVTLFAGLATGIGGLIAFFAKKTNTKFLSAALGFSAGVMIYVSFTEILVKSRESLMSELGDSMGMWVSIASFFGGMLVIAIIDKLVPSFENPHTMHSQSDIEELRLDSNAVDIGFENKDRIEDKSNLYRMGIMSAIAIGIHNFPEGLATFTATVKDPSLGVPIAIAIAIHNVPEGIAVSIPLFYATGSKKKAFIYSFLSGLAEPVGAIVGYLLLSRLFNDMTFGILFGIVAGIMVYISLDELLPASEEYGEHHISIYGLISGMVVMAVSLGLFA